MHADHAWPPSPPRPARAARVTLPSAESGRRASVSQRVRAGRRVSTLWCRVHTGPFLQATRNCHCQKEPPIGGD